MRSRILFLLISLTGLACQSEVEKSSVLFKLLDSSDTGINFRNELSYTEQINPYTFRNFYNGAGVAIGDINQDGLPDIFFTGNQTSNRLYLNLGDFKFKDITDAAGLNSAGYWSTGASMADLNGDGLLDIYVCKSGPTGGERRYNELFINNGDLTFSEKAKELGLAESGLSQHAVFFDYDKDGDLDMYLLSNSGRSVGLFDLREGQRQVRDPEGGNKLFRNEGSKFTDVSEEAGIFGSSIGYGLGVTVADLNEDHWPDLYVSNDFFERDYLYLNNQNGTFSEVLPELLPEISMGSMGADIADLDNDTRPDIFVTEMLPADMARIKTKTPFEEWDKYQANFKTGYHRQFTRNTLQRNLGFRPGTSIPVFAEVSRFAGVEATDWSWGALIFDADLDGQKDLFVANGIVKDLTDFDFVDFYANGQQDIEGLKRDSLLVSKMIDAFPSIAQQNFWFKNLGDWKFTNQADSVGLTHRTFSTGAAYADLDNDGDLDLVVNNLNEEAFIYQNQSRELNKTHFLTLDLGKEFGAKAIVYQGGKTLTQEFQPVKGYMSSVDPRLHFGLGEADSIDSLKVIWPSGKVSNLRGIATNQFLKLNPDSDSFPEQITELSSSPILTALDGISYSHKESAFIDFDRDRLRFWSISNEGPRAAQADLNGDGEMDLFIPGAKGKASQLFLQKAGRFLSHQADLFRLDSLAEDVTALFFDADGNGTLDLLVGSGGIEFSDFSTNYQDRLYLNDGKGNFSRSSQQFAPISTGFLLAHDFDRDQDLDLFVGARALAFGYGIPVGLQVWENDGKGFFTEISSRWGNQFSKMGMLTAGVFGDLDADGQEELIVAGEWSPIRIFRFFENNWIEKTTDYGLDQSRGLWNTLLVEDVNGDGRIDILGGNFGQNSRIRTNPNVLLCLVVNDFDQNGSVEHILSHQFDGKSVPLVLKNPLLRQIPSLKKQLLTYAAYQDKTLEELFPKSIWANSLILTADRLKTSLWLNQGKGVLNEAMLPAEVQYAPVYALKQLVSSTGDRYLIFGGNQSLIKPEMGTQLGSYGWMLRYQGNDHWETLLPQESGLFVTGEIRDFQLINQSNKTNLLVFRNNEAALSFSIR